MFSRAALFLLNAITNHQVKYMLVRGDYLGALEAAIVVRHKCYPLHKETVYVEEKTSDGESVWEGEVEEFELTGHKKATTCYAWQHIDDKGIKKIFAIL